MSPKKNRLKKSDLVVEYLDEIDAFRRVAPHIDKLFILSWGENYPYLFSKSVDKQGPDSRGIGIWYGENLVGFSGFIQNKVDNHLEFGRLIKDPRYDYDLTVIGNEFNRALQEVQKDPYKIFFATTRIWITSNYLELARFKITGSIVYPAYLASAWNDGMCYPYQGLYFLPNARRIKKTVKIPQMIRDLFPKWALVFDVFPFEQPSQDLPVEPIFEDLPPEPIPENSSAIGGKIAYIPCIPNEETKNKILSMVEDGYALLGLFPSWKKVDISGDTVYVSMLLFQKCGDAICNYPTNFALSHIHYQFTKQFHCDENNQHCFYGKPFDELFRRREMNRWRKGLINFYQRFWKVKAYSLYDEPFTINQAASRIFE